MMPIVEGDINSVKNNSAWPPAQTKIHKNESSGQYHWHWFLWPPLLSRELAHLAKWQENWARTKHSFWISLDVFKHGVKLWEVWQEITLHKSCTKKKKSKKRNFGRCWQDACRHSAKRKLYLFLLVV